MRKYVYPILLGIALIILGGSYPKIALSIAGLIFLSALLLNVDQFKKILSSIGG